MKFDAQGFADAVKAKRGNVGLRKVTGEAGVSPATLSRIERGKDFTIAVFTKICAWLGKEPGEFFKEVEKTGNIAVVASRALDFEAYVGEIYAKLATPKNRLATGRKISLTEKGIETVFVLVQYVSDARGRRFKDKIILLGAESLSEYDAIIQELQK